MLGMKGSNRREDNRWKPTLAEGQSRALLQLALQVAWELLMDVHTLDCGADVLPERAGGWRPVGERNRRNVQ